MIKTIFYFVPTEAEYNAAVTKGDITSRTIVFVEDTRTIYLNGKPYGRISLDGLVTSNEFDAFKRIGSTEINNLRSVLTDNVDDLNTSINRIDNDILEATATLNRSIDETRSSINSVSEDLDTFKGGINEQIEQDIQEAITNSDGESIWTALSDVEAGVRSVTTKFDNITDENGNIKYTTALQLVINEGISNSESITDLQNRWALLDENEDVLKWIASGFASHAGEEEAFTSVFSSMVEDANSQEGSLYSGLQTRVADIEGDYVSSATLAADMESTLGHSLSELALTSDIDSASASLLSTIQGVADGIEDSIANVTTTVNRNSAVVTSLATVNDNQSITWNSATIDGAVAGVLASGTSRSGQAINAMITANVKDDQSWITLSADQINLDGDVIATRLTTANAKIGGWTVDEDQLKSTIEDEDGDGNITTKTIKLYGGDEDHAPVIQISDSTINGNNKAIAVTPDGISISSWNGSDEENVKTALNADGSGFLGSGGIKWREDGTFVVNGQFTQAVVSTAKPYIIDLICQGLTALHHYINPSETQYWDYGESGFYLRGDRPPVDPDFE